VLTDPVKKAVRFETVRLVEGDATSMHASQVDYYLRAGRNRKSIDDVIVDSAAQYDGADRLDTHGFLENCFKIGQLRQVVSCQLTLTYVVDRNNVCRFKRNR